MTKQDFRSLCRLNRRSLLQSTAALLSVPLIAKATTAWAEDKLAGSGEVVVYSYGGSFTAGLRQYVFDPFTKATGIKVVDVVADTAEPQVKAMKQAGRVDWDTAIIDSDKFLELEEVGSFEPIDYSLWDEESLAGTPARTRLKSAVVMFAVGMLLAYDQRAFPQGGPQTWADFWDVKKFPGPRGLLAIEGVRNMIFALLADGVDPKDVSPLTDDKVDRALKKLNEIKPHITKWWAAGGEAPQLLINREYAMTSLYDGRAITAIRQGAPIKMVWNAGATLGDLYMTVLKGGANTVNAQRLIAFLNRAKIAAGFTQGTGYPGPNTNQLDHLPPELIPLLNINPENASKFIIGNLAWFAAKRPDGKTNRDYLRDRWTEWRTG